MGWGNPMLLLLFHFNFVPSCHPFLQGQVSSWASALKAPAKCNDETVAGKTNKTNNSSSNNNFPSSSSSSSSSSPTARTTFNFNNSPNDFPVKSFSSIAKPAENQNTTCGPPGGRSAFNLVNPVEQPAVKSAFNLVQLTELSDKTINNIASAELPIESVIKPVGNGRCKPPPGLTSVK